MPRKLLLLALLIPSVCFGRERISGWCEDGNQPVVTPGSQNSTTKVQRSYPACTIKVYLPGTTTLASIYSDNSGTAKANPFTADQRSGQWNFYADDGDYDVNYSGAGISAPFTIGAVSLIDPYFYAPGQSTPRLISQKLTDIISVKDYGAVGDFSNNDTTAIQKALNAAQGRSVYLPTGTYKIVPITQSAKLIGLVVPAGTYFWGPGTLKIANNFGDYDYFMYSSACSGCTFEGITLDANVANNPLGTSARILAHPRIEIFVTAGTNIVIDHVTVQNSSSVNSLDCNGTAVANVVMTNNRGINMGDDPDHIVHDASFIYTDGANVIIANNQISGAEINAPATGTGIETHSTGQSVTGNQIVNYLSGFNITGIDGAGDDNGVAVSGNSVIGALIGMQLWSYPTGMHTSGFGLNGVTVVGNSFRVNQLSYNSAGGATYTYGILLNLGAIPTRNVVINSNSVVFDQENMSRTGNTVSLGIGTFFTTSQINNITVQNNIIDNAPVAGIRFDCILYAANITNNIITDAGSSLDGLIPAQYKVPIRIFLTSGQDLNINRNVIIDDFTTTRMTVGMFVGAAAVIPAVTINDNDIQYFGPGVGFTTYLSLSSNNITPNYRAVISNFTPPAFNVQAMSRVIDPAVGQTYTAYTDGTAWTQQIHSTALTLTGIATVTSGTSPHAVTNEENLILCDTTSGTGVVTMPSAPYAGQIVMVKHKNAVNLANSCFVNASALIDGSSQYAIYGSYETAIFQFDGTTWWSIGNPYSAHIGANSTYRRDTTSGSFQAQANDSLIEANMSSGVTVVYVPQTPKMGQLFTVKKTGTGSLFVGGNALLIDGASSVTMTADKAALILQYTGTAWLIVGSFSGTVP